MPNQMTRRSFFISLGALAVIAGVPLPIGLKEETFDFLIYGYGMGYQGFFIGDWVYFIAGFLPQNGHPIGRRGSIKHGQIVAYDPASCRVTCRSEPDDVTEMMNA